MESNLEANKELAYRAWAAYDRGDEDAFGACLDEAWREYDLSGQSGSAKEVIASMKAHRIAFPDKHTEMLDIIAEGNVVVTNTITRATHTGPYLDLAPTGKRVVVYEICIHTIRDGRVSKTVQAGVAGVTGWPRAVVMKSASGSTWATCSGRTLPATVPSGRRSAWHSSLSGRPIPWAA